VTKRRDRIATGWRRRDVILAPLVERQVRTLIGNEAGRLGEAASFESPTKKELLDAAVCISTLIELLPDQ
jgi:hypothetical protein